METKELKADIRKELGSSSSRRFRREGLIPSVVYGSESSEANLNVLINARQFYAEFHGHISENTIINLIVDGKGRDVLVKDFQSDILTQEIFHIDFLEVVAGHVLRTSVPLILDGTPLGIREGGMLEHQCESVEVECLPKDLPSEFHMEIGHLELGDSLQLKALEVGPKVRILSSLEQIVAHISVPKGLTAAEEAGETEDAEVTEDVAESTE